MMDLEFVGYKRLDPKKGMYLVVLQKPLQPREYAKIDHEEFDSYARSVVEQYRNKYFNQSMSIEGILSYEKALKIARLFEPMRHLKTHAEATVFLEGLTKRYREANPNFVNEIWHRYNTESLYKYRHHPDQVRRIMHNMRKNRKVIDSLAERNTTLRQEWRALLADPVEVEIRQILMTWLAVASIVSAFKKDYMLYKCRKLLSHYDASDQRSYSMVKQGTDKEIKELTEDYRGPRKDYLRHRALKDTSRRNTIPENAGAWDRYKQNKHHPSNRSWRFSQK